MRWYCLAKESIYFELSEMNNRQDPKAIKKGVDTLQGIISVSVNSTSKKVAVDFDSTGTNGEEITQKIKELGFELQIIDKQKHIMWKKL